MSVLSGGATLFGKVITKNCGSTFQTDLKILFLVSLPTFFYSFVAKTLKWVKISGYFRRFIELQLAAWSEKRVPDERVWRKEERALSQSPMTESLEQVRLQEVSLSLRPSNEIINKPRGKHGGQGRREARFLNPDFARHFLFWHFFFRVLHDRLRERWTTPRIKEVRNVDWNSFIQAKNTPASGSLQKVLVTVSVRKLTVQDMISKVFDQPAVNVSLWPHLYVIHMFHPKGEGPR